MRAWLDRAEDLSGHNAAQWLPRASIGDHLGELLREIGKVYTPFLVANAHAAANGQATFETRIDGQLWSQPVFPYQVKCLDTLRQARKALDEDARAALDAVLHGTGCEALFAGSP